VFAFGGHNVFPSVQESMANKKDFNRMFNWAFILILLLYVPAAFAGYYAFGDTVQSPVFATPGLSGGVLIQVALVSITIHLLLTLPLVDNPLNLWVEDLLSIDKRSPEFLFRAISRTLILAAQGMETESVKGS
jgi:amino acid permease